MVNRYCIGCHNDKLKTAGVSLAAVRTNEVGASAKTWEKVLRKVRTGEMPPLGIPKPDPAVSMAFVGWLETQLDTASAAAPDPGAPAIHRLNRAEYGNAVRDLLALDMDYGSNLPPDNAGYGFDNIGDVLTVSPLHMEKYMSSARKISRLAVGTIKASPAVERFPAPRGNDSINELPPNERGGIVVKRYFPLDAEYTILLRARGNPAPNAPSSKLDLRIDGERVKLFDVSVNPAEEAQYTRNYEFRLAIKAGPRVISAGFLNDFAKLEGGAPPRRGFGPPAPPPTLLSVEYASIGGPFNATGPGDTESQRRVFVCRPAAGQAEETCAKKILGSLARRAYRRPVTDAGMQPLMKLFAIGRADGGSFDAGIELGLRAILVAPDFLFRVERSPRGAAAGSIQPVTNLELASRLSFFLWSSIPDEELLSLAEKGKLRDRTVLNQQVHRMLADSRSKALVDNFAGQWLELRNVRDWQPDPEKYREFDESLRTAMERETELFFGSIIREDRSIIDFIDADYTFVNDRLARHYGMKDVRGSYFRRVPLNGPERGGILTQASVLTVTSYPTRTSPVLRGKWILENILGAPPPPPPPDVPTLADTAETSAKNLREALEKHRANIACATCHSRLDPLGFSLENFDAIGKFRTKQGDTEIDASGTMPNGVNVRGPGDLKKVVLEHKDQFVECLSEKLLTYALGRGLEYYDLPAVREIRRETDANEDRFSALVLAIVNSVPFQMRRVTDPAPATPEPKKPQTPRSVARNASPDPVRRTQER